MPEKEGFYWLRITADKNAKSPVVVYVSAEPGTSPKMQLIGTATSYTQREAEAEILEIYKDVRLDFFGPIQSPGD
jgi:hypothetical protein